MTKRRRERDRPKAPHDAPYDPNKRVMLSYSSDDPGSESSPSSEPPVEDAQLANYEIAPYPDDEDGDENDEEYEPQAPQLQQRGSPSYELPPRVENQDVKPPRKERDRSKGVLGGSSGVKRNLETNQWPVLGSLSFQWEDGEEDREQDENDSTTEEAMAYLRDVRTERQNMPSILTAKTHHGEVGGTLTSGEIHQKGGVEEDAHYEQGASIASPQELTAGSGAADDAQDAQKLYNQKLAERFLRMRKHLSLPNSAEMISALDADHPITFPKDSNKATIEWLNVLSKKAPLPAQTHVLKRAVDVTPVTSTWIWSLLSKLQDVGGMNNDEVFPLRQLGKRAIFVHYSFTNPEVAAQLELVEQGETPEEPSVPIVSDEIALDDDLAAMDGESSEPMTTDATQATPAAPTTDAVPTENTAATLYMILTIVGEVYGQRDLLEFRPVWAPSAAAT